MNMHLRSLRLPFVIAALMFAAGVGGIIARPTVKADEQAQRSLASVVPRSFGEWREVPQAVRVVNPQTEALLDTLYSDVLTRTYVNAEGYRIMLSLAYGSDQHRALQAHKPEVCYPAQGFTVHSNEPALLKTVHGIIPARRLFTTMGRRHEPLTYWFTVGDRATPSEIGRRLVQMRFALTGRIPDGTLFRVSSIDLDRTRAYAVQEQFVTALLDVLTPEGRKRLSGLETTAGL